MTTTVTPIITQLSLDRDRLKDLVNGDANTTVQLEGRVEKSIAGQVADRITETGINLTTAVSDATAARDAAIGAKNDAETFKQAAEQAKIDTDLLKNDTESFKNSAEQAATTAQQYYNSISAINTGRSGGVYTLSAISPSQLSGNKTTPIENFCMIGQSFDGNTDNLEFVGRVFELVELDSGFDPDLDNVDEVNPNFTQVLSQEEVTESLYIGTNGYNTTSYYAWRFTDKYHNIEYEDSGDFRKTPLESTSRWNIFKFVSGSEYIEKPILTTTENTAEASQTLQLDASSASIVNSARPINYTIYKIHDSKNRLVYHSVTSGEVSSHVVSGGILREDSTYHATVQYVMNPLAPAEGEQESIPVYSPVSDRLTFTTTSQTSATVAASNASASENMASEWAENDEDVQITDNPGKYSAKHYALKSSASKDMAGEWAENPEDQAVTGNPGKYSALHHASKAATSETNTLQYKNDVIAIKDGLIGANKVVATSDVTLLTTDPQYNFIDTNGVNRKVTLPSGADNGKAFVIKNIGAELVDVYDSDDVTVLHSGLGNGSKVTLVFVVDSWEVL